MTKFTRPWDGFMHDKPMPVPEGERHNRFEIASPFWPQSCENNPPSKVPLQILHIIKTSWEDMRSEDPDFFLGMTLHGSLVKGRSHDESDIDPIIFADENVAAKTLEKHHVDYDKSESFEPYSSAKRFLTKRFQQVIAKPLEDAGLPKSYAKSEVWGPILLENPHDYFETLGKALPRQTEWCIKHKERAFFQPAVPLVFRMRVGSGHIQTFRKSILDGIEAGESKRYSDIAELTWWALANEIVKEEEWNRGATIYFPQTIPEAREYFRL